VTLTLGDRKFKCSTDIFLERNQHGKPSLLELSNADGQVNYTLSLEIQEQEDSLRWIIKPQIVLSNLTGGVLEIIREKQIYGIPQSSSLIGNLDEPFVIRGQQQFKLNVNSLKYKE
jgi:hypothetical protein